MRAFVAARIPVTRPMEAVLARLAAMRSSVKVVAADQLHVTLKFLGETSDGNVPEYSAILREVASGECSRRVKLSGLGVFPRPERPSVIWVGLSDAELLNRLAARFEERFAALGIARETRPFEPHVTLARVKSRPPEALSEFVRHNACADFGAVEIGAIELIHSKLHGNGAQYSTLTSIVLAPSD